MIYEFTCTQDLHGYSKPWAPGANVNIMYGTEYAGVVYSISAGQDISARTESRDYYEEEGNKITVHARTGFDGVFFATDPLPAGTYNVHIESADSTMRANLYTTDSDFIVLSNVQAWAAAGTFNKTVVISDDDTRLVLGLGKNAAGDVEYINIQVEAGSSYTPWTPYSNICMPQGFNMWYPDGQEYVQVYAGYVNTNTRELYLRPWYTEYEGQELVGPWMSSLDEYTEEGTPTSGAFVVDLGGDLYDMQITPFMLQTLLDSLGIRQHFLDGASKLNSLMDQAQGRKRDQRSVPQLKVKPIGDELPLGLKFKAIENMNVLPGLSGKYII